MPLLINPTTNDTCFHCGKQAFYESFNTKIKRCVERVTSCPGVIAKMNKSRSENGFDIAAHMKKMSENGNKKLKELHSDTEWVKIKGKNISQQIEERGGHFGSNNPMYNKNHSDKTKKKQSDKALMRDPASYQKGIITKIAAGTVIPKELKSAWELYEERVDNITHKSWKEHKKLINPNNLKRGKKFNLDHKFSKYEGFLNNVPPEILGHYSNLEILPESVNKSKGLDCSITLEELYKLSNSK